MYGTRFLWVWVPHFGFLIMVCCDCQMAHLLNVCFLSIPLVCKETFSHRLCARYWKKTAVLLSGSDHIRNLRSVSRLQILPLTDTFMGLPRRLQRSDVSLHNWSYGAFQVLKRPGAAHARSCLAMSPPLFLGFQKQFYHWTQWIFLRQMCYST